MVIPVMSLMGIGFGMRLIPFTIPPTVPSWIKVFAAQRMAGLTHSTQNGDGNPRIATCLGLMQGRCWKSYGTSDWFLLVIQLEETNGNHSFVCSLRQFQIRLGSTKLMGTQLQSTQASWHSSLKISTAPLNTIDHRIL